MHKFHMFSMEMFSQPKNPYIFKEPAGWACFSNVTIVGTPRSTEMQSLEVGGSGMGPKVSHF